MIKLLVINNVVRNLIRGEYKKNHELEPVKIYSGKYILNYNKMINVQEIKNPHISFITENWFIPNDGSPNDLIYQEYLKNTKI